MMGSKEVNGIFRDSIIYGLPCGKEKFGLSSQTKKQQQKSQKCRLLKSRFV